MLFYTVCISNFSICANSSVNVKNNSILHTCEINSLEHTSIDSDASKKNKSQKLIMQACDMVLIPIM